MKEVCFKEVMRRVDLLKTMTRDEMEADVNNMFDD